MRVTVHFKLMPGMAQPLYVVYILNTTNAEEALASVLRQIAKVTVIEVERIVLHIQYGKATGPGPDEDPYRMPLP